MSQHPVELDVVDLVRGLRLEAPEPAAYGGGDSAGFVGICARGGAGRSAGAVAPAAVQRAE